MGLRKDYIKIILVVISFLSISLFGCSNVSDVEKENEELKEINEQLLKDIKEINQKIKLENIKNIQAKINYLRLKIAEAEIEYQNLLGKSEELNKDTNYYNEEISVMKNEIEVLNNDILGLKEELSLIIKEIDFMDSGYYSLNDLLFDAFEGDLSYLGVRVEQVKMDSYIYLTDELEKEILDFLDIAYFSIDDFSDYAHTFLGSPHKIYFYVDDNDPYYDIDKLCVYIYADGICKLEINEKIYFAIQKCDIKKFEEKFLN